MRLCSTVLIFGSILLLVLPTQANNNYYLLGGACFSFSISKEFLEKWISSDASYEGVDYTRLDNQFMACGNMGYPQLEFVGVTPAFRQALAEAALRFNTYAPPRFEEVDEKTGKLVQINSIVALV